MRRSSGPAGSRWTSDRRCRTQLRRKRAAGSMDLPDPPPGNLIDTRGDNLTRRSRKCGARGRAWGRRPLFVEEISRTRCDPLARRDRAAVTMCDRRHFGSTFPISDGRIVICGSTVLVLRASRVYNHDLPGFGIVRRSCPCSREADLRYRRCRGRRGIAFWSPHVEHHMFTRRIPESISSS